MDAMPVSFAYILLIALIMRPRTVARFILSSVADPAMGGPGGRHPPPIDQNLGLVMAARLRYGGKFSLKSLTFGHFFV